jgi:osmotically-inducible protein OsmY
MKRLQQFGIAAACAAFTLAGSGAFAAQDPPKQTTVVIKDDTTPKVKKATKVVADTSINTAVKTRLMTDKVARNTDIDVNTKDGVVTLAGAVPTAADKARIGHLVLKTTGVKKVENNLTVK